jgi:hypothetical protein
LAAFVRFEKLGNNSAIIVAELFHAVLQAVCSTCLSAFLESQNLCLELLYVPQFAATLLLKQLAANAIVQRIRL